MIGATVAQFRVVENIGGGGMGVVYKAEDTRLGRFVALKFLPEQFADDPVVLERFRREARAASALNHPNICTVHEIVEDKGHTFIVMEYLEGTTLKELIRENGPVPFDRLLDIALQAANGLQAAHDLGILHRDVKPANIFVTNHGRVKILDFGLAKIGAFDLKVAAGAGSPTREGETSMTGGWAMGTIAYMSPEQALGRPLDQRADVFSFGAVLYEMATGDSPFHGDTTGALFLAVVQEKQVPARQLNPSIPEPLQQIINRCLEKDRGKRFESLSEVIAELKKLQQTTGPDPEVNRVVELAPSVEADFDRVGASAPPANNKRWGILSIVTTLLLGAVLGVVLIAHRSQATRLTEEDTVVLAEFTNTTGESIFDGTLKEAATIDLQQSPMINVLTPQQLKEILKQMGRPPNQRLTQEVTREVCLRSNSKVFIAGSIASEGGGYLISMKAIACSNGHEIASADAIAKDRSSVLHAVGIVDDHLRRKLGESLPSLNRLSRPLEQATTASLAALQEFTQGIIDFQQSSSAEAIPHLRRAIELDPNFAQAYAKLGGAYYSNGERRLGVEALTKAYELVSRTGERERFGIIADYLRRATGQNEEAIGLCQEWIRLYPSDYAAYLYLAGNYHSLGHYDKALHLYRDAIQLAPDRVSAYINAMLSYQGLERYDEAKAIFKAARARKLDNEVLRIARYEVAFLERDSVGMREQIEWASAKPGSQDRLLMDAASTEAYFGRTAKARELLGEAAAAAVREGAKERAAEHTIHAAIWEAQMGNASSAKKLAEQLSSAEAGDLVTIWSAIVSAEIGDNATAAKVVDELNREWPVSTLVQKNILPTIRAMIQLNRNRPQEALSILQPVERYEMSSAFDTGLLPAYVRGRAYLMLHQGPEAAREFQKLLDHPGVVEMSVTGALAHLQLARAKHMAGDNDAARQKYQDFLALWKDADLDIPILKQAKLEYAKLR